VGAQAGVAGGVGACVSQLVSGVRVMSNKLCNGHACMQGVSICGYVGKWARMRGGSDACAARARVVGRQGKGGQQGES
jgi:hypothetical protein